MPFLSDRSALSIKPFLLDLGKPNPTRLELRGPIVVLLAALLLAVGGSAAAGFVGISRLDQSLHRTVNEDVARLRRITHVRRLFRSELLLLHEFRAATSESQRSALAHRKGEIRRERELLLQALEQLKLPEQEELLAKLKQQHLQGDELLEQPEQLWEAAIVALLAGTETRLTQSVKESKAEGQWATFWLLGVSAFSVIFAVVLGGVVLRRVRQASGALLASEEQFRCVVESAPSLLAILSIKNELVFMPHRGVEFFGISSARLLVDPLCWIHEDDRPKIELALAAVHDSPGEASTLMARAVREGAEERRVSIALTPLKDGAGHLRGVVLQILDVTAQWRAEQARSGLEEQLRQSQKMEALGRLTGGIAHDFNNLLTAIKGYGALLQEELAHQDFPARTSTLEDVDGIVEAADRAASLTRQLLAVSRQQIIVPTVTDLGQLIRRMEKLLVRIIGEDVRLTVRIDDGLGLCLIDPSQAEQIILNLAVNARQAMPTGGSLEIEASNTTLDEVYASSHPTAVPGAYVQLSVGDTGTGMSQETQRRAFEPFFTTKPQGQGTGLGLSVVYGAVQQQGGCINLYSEEGIGTTFRIYWPIVTQSGAHCPVEQDSETLSRGHETILVVEDDQLVRSSARKALSRSGYSVIEAGTAEEAISITQSLAQPPDLLLTDVVLPGANGQQLSANLTQTIPQLPVIFCSGYSGHLLTQTGRLSPEVCLLQKPYDAQSLVKSVRRALDDAATRKRGQ